jgi:ketosteroid isomerase-like protein
VTEPFKSVPFKSVFDNFVRALQTRDGALLEDLLTEDFRFTNTNARLIHKRERIASVVGNPVFDTLKFRNVDFEAFGDTCLVFAEFQYEGLQAGMLYFGRSTFVFVRQADAWKLAAQHNSHAQPEVGV